MKLNEDEIKKEEPEQMQDPDMVDALKKLKETTVPKEDYAKLREEHKKLLDAYVEGKEYDKAPKPVEPDIKEIEKKLFAADPNLTNLEYAELSLAHRDYVKKHKGIDEYLPNGDKISPTADDEEKAENVAESLRHCIEFADGDSNLFTSELQRIMIDTAPASIARRRR